MQVQKDQETGQRAEDSFCPLTSHRSQVRGEALREVGNEMQRGTGDLKRKELSRKSITVGRKVLPDPMLRMNSLWPKCLRSC